MLKRSVSLLLTGLMIFMLTGCNTNEMGYLNLSKELNNITQYEFTNKTALEISSNVSGEEDYNVNLDLKGEANVGNLNSMYMNVDVMLNVNGIGNELPVKFVIADNNVYVSKNAILELVKLQEKIDGTTENPSVMDELYNVELKNTDYIMISGLNEFYSSVENNTDYKELIDPTFDYITQVFKGFDTKLVTKINNGYAIELTPEATFEFIERMITYVSDNREMFFDETIEYVVDIYDKIEIAEAEGFTEAEKQAVIEELKAERQDFYDFLDEAVLFIKSDEFKEYENMFERSNLKEEIIKNGSSYSENIKGELVVEDLIIGSLQSSTKMTAANVEAKQLDGTFMAVEELEKLYDKTQNKINPVNKMELSWYPESYEAEINKYRPDGNMDWDYQSYVLIEDRVYLPLRYIGESFGEEVDWDNVNKKAYVIRGTERIDMTGVLINDKTMVKVRDFEKLGYKIDYIQEYGLSTATITK